MRKILRFTVIDSFAFSCRVLLTELIFYIILSKFCNKYYNNKKNISNGLKKKWLQ